MDHPTKVTRVTKSDILEFTNTQYTYVVDHQKPNRRTRRQVTPLSLPSATHGILM